MSLFQDDFWKDYVAVVVLTVILGAGLATGVAALLDTAFGDAVDVVLGEAGRYDLIVHVREEAADGAASEVARLLKTVGDGISVRRGVTVAGNANFFVSIPTSFHERGTLENIPEILADVPGFNGHTWMLEPSVTVSGMRPGVRDLLAAEGAAIDGVHTAVRHGTSVTFLLTGDEARTTVTRQLEQLLAGRQLVEIRPDDPGEGSTPHREAIVTALAHRLDTATWRDVTDVSPPFAGTPVEELQHLLPVWRQLMEASTVTAEAAAQLARIVDELEPAFALAEDPVRQGERLSNAVRSASGPDAVRDALVSVIVSTLLRSVGTAAQASPDAGPDAEATGAAAAGDLAQVRESLAALAEKADVLHEVSEADLTARLHALDEVLALAADETPRVELLTDAGLDAADISRIATDATDGPVHVSVSAPGVVNPNPRALVLALLADLRRAVAGLVTTIVVVGALVLDHATVFAAMQRFPGSRRWGGAVAAAVGALLLGTTYVLSGAEFPYVPAPAVFALGALFGWATKLLAPRLSPVDGAEVAAGYALGLGGGQIMREIVVPAGRPGLMSFVNRRRRKFG